MTYAAGALPNITWLELSTEDLSRWAWQARLTWPHPFVTAGVGRWTAPLDEFMGDERVTSPRRTRGEERLLDDLAEVLRAPQYCAYVIRSTGRRGTSDYYEHTYAAIASGDDAVVIVDEPGAVRIGRTHPTTIAAAIAGQLPAMRAASVTRVSIPARTAQLLAAGFARGDTPQRTLQSALASAGVPESTATRLFADHDDPVAVGMVGAVGYTGDGEVESPRGASWTELSDGGMISQQTRSGEVVWEPLTVGAINRCVVDALGGLGS